MKKLLVLTVVLGLASLASAELMYQVDGMNYGAGAEINKTGTFWISVVNVGEPLASIPAIGGVTTTGTFTGSVIVPDGWVVDDTYLDTLKILMIYLETPSIGPLGVGEMFSVEIIVGVGDTFSLIDEAWQISPDLGEVTFVPEPATMLLLAAGGLLLRRRK